MTEPLHRRGFLTAVIGLTTTGCVGNAGETETPHNTLRPPPSLQKGAVTDILVSTPSNQEIDVTLSAGAWSKELHLDAGEVWRSPDVIGADQSTTVHIRGEGLSLSADWPAENGSQQVLTTFIDPNEGFISATLKNREEILNNYEATERPTTANESA